MYYVVGVWYIIALAGPSASRSTESSFLLNCVTGPMQGCKISGEIFWSKSIKFKIENTEHGGGKKGLWRELVKKKCNSSLPLSLRCKHNQVAFYGLRGHWSTWRGSSSKSHWTAMWYGRRKKKSEKWPLNFKEGLFFSSKRLQMDGKEEREGKKGHIACLLARQPAWRIWIIGLLHEMWEQSAQWAAEPTHTVPTRAEGSPVSWSSLNLTEAGPTLFRT